MLNLGLQLQITGSLNLREYSFYQMEMIWKQFWWVSHANFTIKNIYILICLRIVKKEIKMLGYGLYNILPKK
jgi:hypothetical protein